MILSGELKIKTVFASVLDKYGFLPSRKNSYSCEWIINSLLLWTTDYVANTFLTIPSTMAGNVESGIWMNACCITIGIIGVISNGMVVVVMWKTPHLYQKTPNLIITNQSILDGLAAIFIFLTAVIYIDFPDAQDSLLNNMYCRLWLSHIFTWGFLYASTYNLSILTIERYFSVTRPIRHKIFFTRKRARIIMAIAWFIGGIQASVHGILSSGLEGGKCIVYCWKNHILRLIHSSILLVTTFIFPIIALVYCYSTIVCVLHRRTRLQAYHHASRLSMDSNNDQRRLNAAKKNTVQTMAIVSFLFISCWSWNRIYFFTFSIHPEQVCDYKYDFVSITVVAAFTTCMVNPFVYFFKYDQFRVAFTSLLPCKQTKEYGHSSSSGSSEGRDSNHSSQANQSSERNAMSRVQRNNTCSGSSGLVAESYL